MHPLQLYCRALSQVLLKWNMQRGVPVIPKATSREHLAENFADMFNWRLTNQHKVRGLLYTTGWHPSTHHNIPMSVVLISATQQSQW